MGYEAAKEKAWSELAAVASDQHYAVKFLSDEYAVDLAGRTVSSLACNIPAKDFLSILILHYLAKKLHGLPALTGEWQDFRELSHVEGYGKAFRERAIEPLIRKYGNDPQALTALLERIPGRKAEQGDAGIVVNAFEGVPVMITLWRGDDEFGPDANVLFDKSASRIFCVEDIAVLGERIARAL